MGKMCLRGKAISAGIIPLHNPYPAGFHCTDQGQVGLPSALQHRFDCTSAVRFARAIQPASTSVFDIAWSVLANCKLFIEQLKYGKTDN